MIKNMFGYLLQFMVLVALQLLIFNNIELSGFINPYIYILFILLLPFETPKALLLFIAFALGLVIDLFMGTPGVHSTATVLMAFARPVVLKVFSPHDGYQANTLPRLNQYGMEWFVKYTVALVLLHHCTLFYLEVFTFHGFFNTLSRALLSAAFTVILIIISQFFVFRH
jgi:rod shape-determining protein MreD